MLLILSFSYRLRISAQRRKRNDALKAGFDQTPYNPANYHCSFQRPILQLTGKHLSNPYLSKIIVPGLRIIPFMRSKGFLIVTSLYVFLADSYAITIKVDTGITPNFLTIMLNYGLKACLSLPIWYLLFKIQDHQTL